MAELFEIVCDAATLPLAEAVSLLLHAGSSPALHSLTVLAPAAAADFFSPQGAGAPLIPHRLPVLYDNLHSLALTLPLAALRHAAQQGGALAQRGSEDTAAADGVRGSVLAEVAVGWLGAPSGSATEGARRCALLSGLLASNARPAPEGAAPALTHGDLLAWLCMDAEAGRWGAGAVLASASPALLDLLSTTVKSPGVAAFLAARRVRRGGGSGAAPAAAAHPAPGAPSAASAAAAAPPPQPLAPPPGHAIAVTGASGFLASWVVKALLELGGTVHGTVRSLQQVDTWVHLVDLPGAGGSEALPAALAQCTQAGGAVLVSGRLRLYPADLLGGPAPFQAALQGCHTLMHIASPYDTSAPKEALLAPDSPALAGTDAVLRAAEASPALRRIVLTSSAAAVYCTSAPSDHVYSEADWSEPGVLEGAKSWYALGKLRAERAAWDFILSERHVTARAALRAPPLTMAAICPTQCLGPLLAPRMNQSSAFLAQYASGAKATLPAQGKCLVDVREAAMAHVLAAEGGNGSPRLAVDGSGRQTRPERYLLVAGSLPWKAIADVLRSALPKGMPIPTALDSAAPSTPQALCSQAASYRLGVRYRPMEVSIAEAAQSFLEWGLLEAPRGGAAAAPPPQPVPARRIAAEEVAGALGGSAAAASAAQALLQAAAASAASALASPQAQAALEAVGSYRTPFLAPGGGCAAGGGRMAPTPFPLVHTLHDMAHSAGASEASLGSQGTPLHTRQGLLQLRELCAALALAVKADWVGVYAAVPPLAPPAHVQEYGADGVSSSLLKLAYIGEASRAYFPLTSDFAAGSNNSTVGLSGAVVHIADVAALPGGAPYYNCDGKVRSEVCLPIVGAGGRVIGIVDAEAFAPQAFDAAALQTLYEVTLRLPELLHAIPVLEALMPSR